jgi:uncharacterized protein YecT (DUF1311 family)
MLCGSIVFLPFLFSQQTSTPQSSATPKEIHAPEQKEYQQQRAEYMVKRQRLQAQGKQILAAEMAREKAGDCTEANTTYDFNVCYGKQMAITEQNLKDYEGIIRELIAPSPQPLVEPDTDTTGVAGTRLTPKHLIEEFERVEQSWRQYRETACSAAFHQFGGGTGGPSFEMECELRLARDHVRELEMIYGEDLLL